MLALIMAGGCGSRLNAGEKPLVNICGNPMIYHVIRAFEDAGCELVIVSSPKTPFTKNWCRTNGFEIYNSGGTGYVEDMISTWHQGRMPVQPGFHLSYFSVMAAVSHILKL